MCVFLQIARHVQENPRLIDGDNARRVERVLDCLVEKMMKSSDTNEVQAWQEFVFEARHFARAELPAFTHSSEEAQHFFQQLFSHWCFCPTMKELNQSLNEKPDASQERCLCSFNCAG